MRRAGLLGGVVVVVVLATAGVAVVAVPRSVADRETPAEPTTASTTTSLPSGAVELPLYRAPGADGGAMATFTGIFGALPPRGIGIVDADDQLVLVDDRGRELARSYVRDRRLVSPEDVAVLTAAGGKAELVGDSMPRTTRTGCLPGDSVGGITVQRCGTPASLPPRIEVVVDHRARVLLRSPPLPGRPDLFGGWRSAKLSPDGRTVLAQWSGECEVPHTFFVDVRTGDVSLPMGEPVARWNEAPATTSAGWLHDGDAVIARSSTGCGTWGVSGVYAVGPGGMVPHLLHRTDSPVPEVFAWRLDPRSVNGACDLPVIADALPFGWDPTPQPGWAYGHETAGAIAHWTGPDRERQVITAVGAHDYDLAVPLGEPAANPVELFTSMGNPAFVFPTGGRLAARVLPTNAPAACSPLYLIGDNVTPGTLRTMAESLRSQHEPPPGGIGVHGAAVRGTPLTIRARGPVWPDADIEVELSNLDGYGAQVVAVATHATDGSLDATFTVPGLVHYEGPCPTSEGCDFLPITLGPKRVRFREVRGTIRPVIGEGTITVVAAKPGVAYDTKLYGECGPPRVELDGVTYVATRPTTLVGEGIPPVDGTTVVTSEARATFRTIDGAVVALRRSPSGFLC
jgi:hypothetical protein